MSRGGEWPTVEVEFHKTTDDVVWTGRDGKPRCARHPYSCLVRASALSLAPRSNTTTYLCAICMQEAFDAREAAAPAPPPVEDAQEPPATPDQRVKGLMESLGDAVDRAKADRHATQEPPVEERCAYNFGGSDICGRVATDSRHIDRGDFLFHPFVSAARPETEVERDG